MYRKLLAVFTIFMFVCTSFSCVFANDSNEFNLNKDYPRLLEDMSEKEYEFYTKNISYNLSEDYPNLLEDMSYEEYVYYNKKSPNNIKEVNNNLINTTNNIDNITNDTSKDIKGIDNNNINTSKEVNKNDDSLKSNNSAFKVGDNNINKTEKEVPHNNREAAKKIETKLKELSKSKISNESIINNITEVKKNITPKDVLIQKNDSKVDNKNITEKEKGNVNINNDTSAKSNGSDAQPFRASNNISNDNITNNNCSNKTDIIKKEVKKSSFTKEEIIEGCAFGGLGILFSGLIIWTAGTGGLVALGAGLLASLLGGNSHPVVPNDDKQIVEVHEVDNWQLYLYEEDLPFYGLNNLYE